MIVCTFQIIGINPLIFGLIVAIPLILNICILPALAYWRLTSLGWPRKLALIALIPFGGWLAAVLLAFPARRHERSATLREVFACSYSLVMVVATIALFNIYFELNPGPMIIVDEFAYVHVPGNHGDKIYRIDEKYLSKHGPRNLGLAPVKSIKLEIDRRTGRPWSEVAKEFDIPRKGRHRDKIQVNIHAWYVPFFVKSKRLEPIRRRYKFEVQEHHGFRRFEIRDPNEGNISRAGYLLLPHRHGEAWKYYIICSLSFAHLGEADCTITADLPDGRWIEIQMREADLEEWRALYDLVNNLVLAFDHNGRFPRTFLQKLLGR